MIPDFILIDDQQMNNIVCRSIIKKVFPAACVQAFIDPYAALAYIKGTYSGANASDAVLLLDINMLPFSGWDFLDAFEQLENNLKKRFKVYILSSSANLHDRQRAVHDKNVLEFIEQPLTIESLNRVMAK